MKPAVLQSNSTSGRRGFTLIESATKNAADRGAIPDQGGQRRLSAGDLETLLKGVDVGGNKMRFLRRIPLDPMTNSTEWGLRAVQDDPQFRLLGRTKRFRRIYQSSGHRPGWYRIQGLANQDFGKLSPKKRHRATPDVRNEVVEPVLCRFNHRIIFHPCGQLRSPSITAGKTKEIAEDVNLELNSAPTPRRAQHFFWPERVNSTSAQLNSTQSASEASAPRVKGQPNSNSNSNFSVSLLCLLVCQAL